MQIPFEPDDPHLLATIQHIANRAVEGIQGSPRINYGTVSVSCTANQTATKAVTFMDGMNKNPLPFRTGTTPVLFLFVNPSVATSLNKPSYTGLSNTGFTLQVVSDTAQTVTVSYLAIGQA